ncbi:MAG: hypothetical protein IPM94_03435 [bacterium]|nr:hypothetical protein [bacterium]
MDEVGRDSRLEQPRAARRLQPEDDVVVVDPAGRALLVVAIRLHGLQGGADEHAVGVHQNQGGSLLAQVELRLVLHLQRHDRQLADQRRHVGRLSRRGDRQPVDGEHETGAVGREVRLEVLVAVGRRVRRDHLEVPGAVVAGDIQRFRDFRLQGAADRQQRGGGGHGDERAGARIQLLHQDLDLQKTGTAAAATRSPGAEGAADAALRYGTRPGSK